MKGGYRDKTRNDRNALAIHPVTNDARAARLELAL